MAFPCSEFYIVPSDFTDSIKELAEDLAHVPVRDEDGRVTNAFEKFEQTDLLTREDKDLIWKCLSVVRNAFKQLEKTHLSRREEKGYQWNMNWKHIRAEIDQVLEACRLLNLDSDRTRDAILASIFSDCAKNRKNFIIHNIHGAQAAELILRQLLDLNDEKNQHALDRIVRAVKQHQIAPPEFMARVVAIMICHRLSLGKFELLEETEDRTGEEDLSSRLVKQLVLSIFSKIKEPFDKNYLTDDLATVNFSYAERQLLVNIGVDDWFVPHPDNPDSLIAHAVIAGDHSINYNHPEGFAKIALLRGPDTEEIFEDPTIHHSLDSAVKSFSDSFRVIRPEVQRLAVDGLRKTMLALARVTAVMNELFSGLVVGPKLGSSDHVRAAQAVARARTREPELFSVAEKKIPEVAHQQLREAMNKVDSILDDWYETHGEIPFNPKSDLNAKPGPGTLPFWNTPLAYPPRDDHGDIELDKMTDLEKTQYLFATRIRAIAVELLRAESWVFGFPGPS
jgi:hypothetical protein